MPTKTAATTKTPKTPKAAPATVRKPRRSAKELREEAEKARQESWSAFEAQRHSVWVEMWAKALRLKLVTEHMMDFRDQHSWWFEDFHVNAREQNFQLEDTGSMVISEEKLHPSDVDRINSALDMAFEWVTEFEAEQERKRQEALERERRRQEALSKLNDEDKKILGLSRN
jgi:glutamate-1-semialdehyde aminotransferase